MNKQIFRIFADFYMISILKIVKCEIVIRTKIFPGINKEDIDFFHVFKLLRSFGKIHKTHVISMWLIITVGVCLVHGYFICLKYQVNMV
jgi:hypothetical protein